MEKQGKIPDPKLQMRMLHHFERINRGKAKIAKRQIHILQHWPECIMPFLPPPSPYPPPPPSPPPPPPPPPPSSSSSSFPRHTLGLAVLVKLFTYMTVWPAHRQSHFDVGYGVRWACFCCVECVSVAGFQPLRT